MAGKNVQTELEDKLTGSSSVVLEFESCLGGQGLLGLPLVVSVILSVLRWV